jgi:hypothetical protein
MFCSKQVMIGASKNIWGFDPRSVPGCVVWLDAADTSTLTLSGSNITAWRDKSIYGNNVNSISATPPTYNSADSSVNFVATSGTFLRGTMSQTYSNSASVFVVVSIASQTSPLNPRISLLGSSATSNSVLIGQQLLVSSNTPRVITFLATSTNPSGQGTNIMTLVSNVTYGTRQLITNVSSFIPSTYTISTFLNGDPQTTSVSTRTGTFTANPTNISNYNKYSLANTPDAISTGGDSFSGKIFEYLVFNNVLTAARRQQIEGYLTWKWGLSGFSTIPSPLSVPGCVLWLDASDNSTITLSGSSITQWNDKSAAGNNMTPFSTFSNATVSSNFQNQLNVINFSANGVYRGPTSTGPYPSDVYLVMALKDTTTHVDVISVHSSNAGSTFNSLSFGEYTASRWHNGSDGFARTPNTVSPSNETSTNFLLMNWSLSNSNYIIRRNGVVIRQTTSYTYTNPADARFQIGFRVNPAAFSPATTAGTFRGYIGEVVAFNSQLSYDQRRQVEIYLGNKWGLSSAVSVLPSTHPYSSLRPHLSTFRPFDVPGCELWFDGGDYRTMFQNTAGTTPITAAGQSVACWKDKIRNISVTDTGISGRASVAPTAVSGGGLLFNNVSTSPTSTTQSLGAYLTGATNQTAFLFRMPTKTMTIVTVSLPLSNNGYRRICLLGSYPFSGGPPNFILGPQMGASEGGSGAADLNSAMTAWGQNFSTSSGYNSNAVLRIDTMIMSNTGLWFTNGTSNTITINPTYTTANSNYPVNFIYFAGYSSTIDGGRSFNGTIYETILYSRGLEANERQQVEGYLAHKWGLSTSLPAAHLYRTIPAAAVVPPVVDPLINGTGNNDIFVVKYNSSGTPLWARRMAGTDSDIAYSVSTDSSGNIIVAGYYYSTSLNIFAADGTTVSFTLANVISNGSTDAFVVKYDSSGTPLWARKIGAMDQDVLQSVSTDSSGNVIVTGSYTSNPLNIFAANGTTVSFTLSSSEGYDIFVLKYNSSGTPLWARRIGGSLNDFAYSVSTDSSGNVIVTGSYTSNLLNIFAADETTVSFTLANVGETDSFVVKYNSSGTPLWARRMGGTLLDQVWLVTTDSSGNIVVAGYYTSNPLNIYAANGTTVSFTLSNPGGYDTFVVKYDSSGTPLWARRIGGSLSDFAYSVSTDSSGNIVVTGQYQSTLNIFAADGTTVSFTLSNSGSVDAFVVKYNSSGTPLWARRMGGTNGEIAQSVSTDSSGNIVVAGTYASSPLNIFAADGTTILFALTNTNINNDSFVVKYDSAGTPVWARRIYGTGSEIANSVSTDSSGNIVVAGTYISNPLSFY